MNERPAAYWIVTGLFCALFALSGTGYLLQLDRFVEGITHLGYPLYVLTILGVAKLAGAVALLLPGRPILKEWAYAGFAFDLLGAIASHSFAGDPFSAVIPPTAVLSEPVHEVVDVRAGFGIVRGTGGDRLQSVRGHVAPYRIAKRRTERPAARKIRWANFPRFRGVPRASRDDPRADRARAHSRDRERGLQQHARLLGLSPYERGIPGCLSRRGQRVGR